MPINVIRPGFIFMLVFVFILQVDAQTYADKQRTVQKVFDNIVNAFGNAKAAPLLKLLPNTQKERVVAAYSTTPQPCIKVDEQLVDICFQLKADSLNALAIIISHELAHYYNDHTFCSDYAFAIQSKILLKASKESRIEKETKADRDGLFYAMIAGYQPLQSFEKILNSIYNNYKLPANLTGYPSLSERKKIISYQTEEVKNLLAVYNAGLLLLYLNYLVEAEDCFAYLSVYFPSREVYNNLGVAKFLQAVQANNTDSINIIYPIDIDPVSRLYISSTRSYGGENKDTKVLLKEAKKSFEKAQSLDPNYFTSYINLACTNTALQNYEMAWGNINEASELGSKNDVQLIHIKAIIMLKKNRLKEGFMLFEKIIKEDSLASYNYNLINTALKSNNSLIKIEAYKDEWLNFLMSQNVTKRNDLDFKHGEFNKNIDVNNELKVRRDNAGNIGIFLIDKRINANIKFDIKKNQSGINITNNVKGSILFPNREIVYEVENL